MTAATDTTAAAARTSPTRLGTTGPRAVLYAVPGLIMCVAGFLHPGTLTADTSWRWWHLHVPGVLAFPLVGLALIVLVRGRTDAVSWVVRLAAYGYMTFYTALDVLDGIGAGYLVHGDRSVPVDASGAYRLFEAGKPYEAIGSWSLVVACIAVVVDTAVSRARIGDLRTAPVALPVLLLLPGAWLVHEYHIFHPQGALGMALLGVGTAFAALARPPAGVKEIVDR